MTNRPPRLAVEVTFAAALLAGLALAACHAKPGPDAKAGPDQDPAAANDQRIVDGMKAMRARALAAPGGSTEASDFAFHVTLLYKKGVAKRRNISPTLLEEAVKCLDQAKEANPDDAADLLARQGEMLLAADKDEAGVAVLNKSIADRPNMLAFKPLVKYLGDHKQTAEREALCRKTLPAMKTEGSRYAVLDECLKNSGSAAPEVGLRWAPVKDVSFYRARKKALESRLEAAKKARAKEEGKKP